MIIAGFTGQLRGWWDNFLTPEERYAIMNAYKEEIIRESGTDEKGQPAERTSVKKVEDVVYTLVLTILEHFNGRFFNQNETIRTLLNGLKCKHLGHFRWYKDTFMSRVMELPESKYEYWKNKFIDGLPPLFAERVKKILRGDNLEIPYDTLTYGKLIGTCTQEGLNLCNELKLAQQIKNTQKSERSQLGDFCTQFGIEGPSSSKQRINRPEERPHKGRHRSKRYKEKKEEKKSHRKATRFANLISTV